MKVILDRFFVLCCLVFSLSLVDGRVPLEDFFPFGTENGDSKLTRIDDGSSPKINLQVGFPFVNNNETSLWVNTNGDITFHMGISSYTPECKPLGKTHRMIIPFWTDIDMQKGGNVIHSY